MYIRFFFLSFFLSTRRCFLSNFCTVLPQVSAGWGHTSVLTREGSVFVCGRNCKGQLGLGSLTGFPINERGHPYQPSLTNVASVGYGTKHGRIAQVYYYIVCRIHFFLLSALWIPRISCCHSSPCPFHFTLLLPLLNIFLVMLLLYFTTLHCCSG
jgi:hypothetical protein